MRKIEVKNAVPFPVYIGDVETMGARIRTCRVQRGLTLEVAAQAIGITASALSQWENDQVKNLRPENFLNFCAYYEVDPYYIVFGQAREKSPTGRFRRLKAP